MLLERKARLEATISALEKEQENFAKTLKARTITEQQITSLQEFAEQITDRIDIVAADFTSMRRVLELLDVRVVLAVEDGHKVIYVTSGLGSGRVSPASQSTSGSPDQTEWVPTFSSVRTGPEASLH